MGNHVTCRDEALRDVQSLDAFHGVSASCLEIAGNLRWGNGHVKLALGEAIHLLQEEVEDVEPVCAHVRPRSMNVGISTHCM